MGRTKTVCYCKSRKCKSSSPAVGQAPYEQTRRETIDNLRTYLAEEPCVPGETNETLRISPVAEQLTRAYRKALGRMATAVEADDADGVLRHGATVGDVIRELVQEPTLLPMRFEAPRVPTALTEVRDEHRERVQRFLEEYTADEGKDAAPEVDEFADLLGRSYCKALAELESALDQQETTYITHHTAVVADLVGEMIELWVLRTDYFSEEALADDHPHKGMYKEKLKRLKDDGHKR